MEKKERSRPSGKTQGKPEKLTSVNGRPIADNEDSQTAGLRGPIVLQDPWMLEKLAHFDREVIPERRMHAKGSGAYGTFTVTHDITRYTRASIFSRIGKQTECFVRFSTVAGERGAADAERDIRGFAMKFYTDAGNWDLVGNNTPVFFLRDPVRFPDLNHAIKRDPRTGMRSVDNNWDFWTLLPEALHQVTITMSTRGIPASFRHMHGFGSHTYSFYDAENRRTWVKFHLRTMQGILELNRNPENFYAEVEQAAFNPLNIVDGIGFSPDKMLQGRLFSYGDAQRYRLGVNLDQIPVNRPRVAVHSYHRDGAMRVDGNFGATVSYTPNSYGVWSDSPELKEPPLPLHGPVDNYDERAYDDDYYSQPGALFRLMTPEEKQALFENTARAMGDCKLFIKQRHVRNCYRADPAYGRGLADALGIALDEALDEKNDPALHPAAAMV